VKFRLNGGKTPTEGYVEVYYNGTWGSICKELWDLKDATVACKSMGMPTATYALSYTPQFGRSNQKSWMSRLQCTGSETSLVNCIHAGWGNTSASCYFFYNKASAVCGVPQGKN
jgi:deleted-in-malignant-brain-tumors protein 1